MYKNLTDSHFHILEMKKKSMDVRETLDNCFNQGYSYLIDIGVTEEALSERLDYSTAYNKVKHTVGIHPNCAGGNLDSRMGIIENQISQPNVIGLGETGLDYYWDKIDKAVQKEFFISHLKLAEKYNIPVVIHNREACDDILRTLNEIEFKGRGIIHCFSSESHYVNEFLKFNLFISFAGNITYKKNSHLRNSLLMVPNDRLLIETDAPYLSPQKKRGKNNTPEYIGYTASFIAETKNTSTEEIINNTKANLCRLFDLPGDSL